MSVAQKNLLQKPLKELNFSDKLKKYFQRRKLHSLKDLAETNYFHFIDCSLEREVLDELIHFLKKNDLLGFFDSHFQIYFERVSAKTEESCVKRLWGQVLQMAINDCVYRHTWSPSKKCFEWKRHQDAVSWIFRESEEPGSFLWACGMFELAPEAVRKRIRPLTLEYCKTNPDPFSFYSNVRH